MQFCHCRANKTWGRGRLHHPLASSQIRSKVERGEDLGKAHQEASAGVRSWTASISELDTLR